ncbi:MAG: cellulase [Verrucomicrobiota bacterium]|jgi:photosystem II stability/assembly factor-like uncharacterized protein
MTKAVRLFGWLLALGLAWPRVAAAQAPASRPPASEPYLWRNVTMGGGGFVTGIIFHPREKNLIYARTDVGGAYRWEAAAQKWIPITDWIGVADENLTGIESLALDPADPNRVYLAAGTYNRGKAAILRSANRGKTFARTDVPFKMGGNETGRANGERLAVDPNDGDILFFGSRSAGLWKSADRGATWNKVEGFPEISPAQAAPSISATNSRPRDRGGFGPQQAVGIICVVFDPSSGRSGSPTPVIFAAASTTATNFYRSADAGVTWQPVMNQPVGLRPNHAVLSPDGMFYLTYGREPGPNTMTDGAVWKFNPKDGAWADITPEKPAGADQPFGYGAVAVDARHPATLMVTTFAHWHPHDEIFRSTNSGAGWTQLWQDNTEWDHSSAPYTKTRTPHWMGDIKINPFDSDQALFTTGYGIWSCVNATKADSGNPTRWVFFDDGLEETVPLALISPPEGPHLISGVGDIDGFVHDDLTVSPPQGTFSGPRFGNTEDLAFAAKKAQVIVRCGTENGQATRAAFSLDGGKSWERLRSRPSDGASAGAISISCDGATVVWTPQRSPPYVTTNWGANWTPCAGLRSGIRVVADTVNSSRFYAYDAGAGKLLASTNGAVDFSATEARFEPAQEAGFGGGAELVATPGIEGDLWLALRRAGLHHSTNGGARFAKLPSVQEAASLGFGKAGAGQPFPALYLAGRIGGLQALFRSDDIGLTWVRINDDQHQFGYINRVTGDPRIYGRVYFATGGRGVIYGEPAPNSN